MTSPTESPKMGEARSSGEESSGFPPSALHPCPPLGWCERRLLSSSFWQAEGKTEALSPSSLLPLGCPRPSPTTRGSPDCKSCTCWVRRVGTYWDRITTHVASMTKTPSPRAGPRELRGRVWARRVAFQPPRASGPSPSLLPWNSLHPVPPGAHGLGRVWLWRGGCFLGEGIQHLGSQICSLPSFPSLEPLRWCPDLGAGRGGLGVAEADPAGAVSVPGLPGASAWERPLLPLWRPAAVWPGLFFAAPLTDSGLGLAAAQPGEPPKSPRPGRRPQAPRTSL